MLHLLDAMTILNSLKEGNNVECTQELLVYVIKNGGYVASGQALFCNKQLRVG